MIGTTPFNLVIVTDLSKQSHYTLGSHARYPETGNNCFMNSDSPLHYNKQFGRKIRQKSFEKILRKK